MKFSSHLLPFFLIFHHLGNAAAKTDYDDTATMNIKPTYKKIRNLVGKKLNGVQRTDVKGNKYEHFQQTINGIPVWGSDMIVSTTHKVGLQQTENKKTLDHFFPGIVVDTESSLSPDDALDRALDYTGDREQIHEHDAELFILRHNGKDHLTYQVQLEYFDEEGYLTMPLVFVDAHSGDIIWSYENLKTVALQDAQKITYDWNNNSPVVGDSSDTVLNNLHGYVQQVLDFLATKGFNSYDDNGAVALSVGHVQTNYVNAYWNGQGFFYGDGDNVVSSTLAVLDVCAHEIGHAVTQFSAGLIYRDESGALNEGSSDIFAAVVEAWVDEEVTIDTWNIGEDAWLRSDALRYMQRPSADGSSRDHYSNRYEGSADNGGVHWNSGIANHFFYLLSVGGKHWRAEHHTSNVVTGIGIDTAFDIYFHAWTNKMVQSTTFHEARAATLESCEELEYSTSICDSVNKAWREVGVEGACSNNSECDDGNPCTRDVCGSTGQCEYTVIPGCNSCGSGLEAVQIKLKTDNYGSETSWGIVEKASDITIQSATGLAKNTEHNYAYCIPDTCHQFVIRDSFGDGICCRYGAGSYSVQVNGVEVASGAQFSSSETTDISTSCNTSTTDPPSQELSESPTESPTDSPTDSPTKSPTDSPTNPPTKSPTDSPTNPPTKSPTDSPTKPPTKSPTDSPTNPPTKSPTDSPTKSPIASPTKSPTKSPIGSPTKSPTKSPIGSPTKSPTKSPIGSPTKSPTKSPIGSPTKAPTSPTNSCGSNEEEVDITLVSDNYGYETSWKIIERASGNTVHDQIGFENSKEYNYNFCLPASCHEFVIEDSYGDGICCSYGSGSYSIKVNGVEVGGGAQFGSSETKEISASCSNPTEAPSLSPSLPPTEFPTRSPVDQGCGVVSLLIKTDSYGSETSWKLRNAITGNLITYVRANSYANGLAYSHPDIPCLRDGSYTFTIRDSYGDGLCCSYGQGSYSLSVGGTEVASGGQFGSRDSTSFTWPIQFTASGTVDVDKVCEDDKKWKIRNQNDALVGCKWVAFWPKKRCELVGTDLRKKVGKRGILAADACRKTCSKC